MLSKIITKQSESKIIDFLVIEGENSISDIARKTKTTKANTFHALRKLEKLGLVRKKVAGRTHLYRFNFLHPIAREIIAMQEKDEQIKYNEKLNGLPLLLHYFLSVSLKNNYLGSIFFGSSLKERHNDIDLFIILKEMPNVAILKKKIGLINEKISPIFGLKNDIIKGIENKDMLYSNIVKGIAFGYEISDFKHREIFLRKQDIRERFIIGYREILSCLEFNDTEYIKSHLKKGTMDFIYAVLNYYEFFPENDKEAINLFWRELKEREPRSTNKALFLINKYSWILQ